MAERVMVPEWRADQENTKYPFTSEATLINSSGFFIPETAFLDAIFYPVGGQGGLYISSISVTRRAGQQIATITLSDEGTDGLMSAEFDVLNPPSLLEFFDTFDRPAGVIVSEPTRLSVFQSWGLVVQNFSVDMTEFVSAVVVPSPEVGVRGIVTEDGTILYGDVWIVGDDGVVVSKESVTTPEGETFSAIRVDVVGDPLFRRRLCHPDFFETPRYIKSLMVETNDETFEVTPDAYGGVRMTVGQNTASDVALRVRTTPDGIVLEAVGTTAQTAGDG